MRKWIRTLQDRRANRQATIHGWCECYGKVRLVDGEWRHIGTPSCDAPRPDYSLGLTGDTPDLQRVADMLGECAAHRAAASDAEPR